MQTHARARADTHTHTHAHTHTHTHTQVLSLPPADIALNVPFSEYGGDSLLGIEVLSRAARLRDGGPGGGGLVLGAAARLTADFEMLSIQDLVNKARGGSDGGGALPSWCPNPGPGAGVNHHGAGGKGTHGSAGGGTRGSLVILERSKHETASAATPVDTGGIASCAHGDLSAARALRAGGWDPASVVDKHGNTPLMWAAGAGHLDVVRWLIEEQSVDVEDRNKQGRSALMWAAKNGQLAVVRWMLEDAPLPRASASAQMKDGSRAWDWAIYGGDLPTLHFLAAHPEVDIHGLNYFGCGAAFWAAASGNVATCTWLLSQGIDFSLINDAGHTAVHKAAWKGHKTCLTWMILSEDGPGLGYQLHMLAADGRTPEDKARVNGHTAVANWLQSLQARFPSQPQ